MSVSAPVKFVGNAVLALAISAVLCLAAHPASADVRKIMKICEKKLCPVYLPQLPVPGGWTVDTAASGKMDVLVLVPKGSNFGRAEAVIYGRAFHNATKKTVDQRVAESNRDWKTKVKGARITRLEDVEGSKAGVPFQVFQYSNPGQRTQGAEIVAFGEDTDKEGNLYGVQIVLTALDERALLRNKEDLLAVLKYY